MVVKLAVMALEFPTWVVVKILVPFWVHFFLRHRGTPKGIRILNSPHNDVPACLQARDSRDMLYSPRRLKNPEAPNMGKSPSPKP